MVKSESQASRPRPAADLDGWDASAEFLAGTNPLSSDTDGDQAGDAVDTAPLDPAVQ